MGLELPWEPRSRSMEGRQTEKKMVKARGGRVHPNSGAGPIKDDGSTDTELLEIKDANKVHSINAGELLGLYNRATRQGKQAQYIVKFKNGVVATLVITKE